MRNLRGANNVNAHLFQDFTNAAKVAANKSKLFFFRVNGIAAINAFAHVIQHQAITHVLLFARCKHLSKPANFVYKNVKFAQQGGSAVQSSPIVLEAFVDRLQTAHSPPIVPLLDAIRQPFAVKPENPVFVNTSELGLTNEIA